VTRIIRSPRGIGLAAAVGLLACIVTGGRDAAGQGYSQIVNTSGAAIVNGVTLITAGSGGAGSFTPCGSALGPYFFSSAPSSYTFTFAIPVGSVQIQLAFAAGGVPGAVTFEVDGSPYPLTEANLAGPAPGSGCSSGLAATVSDGDLVNTVAPSADPNALVVIPGPLSTLKVSTTAPDAAVFGVFFSPDSYFQVTHVSGVVAVDRVGTTVTGSGSAGSFTPCGAVDGPYYLPSNPGQYTFQFSSPVDGVNVPVVFASGGTAGSAHFAVDGSAVSLAAANLAGPVSGNACSPGLAAAVSGGDLSNTGNTALNPNGLVQIPGPITTLTVSNPASDGFVHGLFITAGSAAALAFSNPGTQPMTVSQDASATSIDALLAAVDANAGMPLTWDVAVAPAHGTLGGFPASASATGSTVTPTLLTYTPSPGYFGSDGFAVQAYDGINTVTIAVNVTVISTTTTTTSTTTSTSTSSTSSTSTSTSSTTTSTSTSTSSSSTTTSTSTSTSSTTATVSPTTTTPATTTTTTTLPVPSCGMGAGVSQPGKSPKNRGAVKIVKGLVATPATKSTRWSLTGSLDACTGLPTAPKTATPMTSGSIALRLKLPPGGTCTTMVPGAPAKVQMVVKWSSLVNGKRKVVAKDKFTALAAFERQGTGMPVAIQVATAAIVDAKSALVGKHLVANVVIDESQAAIDAACAGNGGIASLHFTGAQGPSTIMVVP